MRALSVIVTEDGSRELKYESNYPIPTPSRGEVLIKVTLAGICGTDHHVLDDFKTIEKYLVLGHEFVGVIDSFGPDCPIATSSSPTTTKHQQPLTENDLKNQPLQINDRVVAEINCIPYGVNTPRTTYDDRAHDTQRCAFGLFGKDGAFADYISVPYENVHKVPDNVATRVAVFTEPIAAACQILQQIHIHSTDQVAVLGAGKLGWIVAKVLAANGIHVHMVTRRTASSLPEYVRRFGTNEDHIIPVISLFDEKPLISDYFDVVVDCTGNPKGLQTAIQIVKTKGTIVLKSTCGPSQSCPLDLTPIVIKEIRLVGSRCGPFKSALRLLQNGWLDIDSLITDVFSIEHGELAMAKSREQGVLKILLKFG